MAQIGQRLDAAGATGQHEAVDDGTGPGSVHGIAEQPTLSASGKNPDITLKQIVVDRQPAVFGVARQILPLVQCVGHGIAKLGIGQDLRRDVVEPCLESVQDGDTVLLAEAADAGGLRLSGIWSFVSSLTFNVSLRRGPPCEFLAIS